MSAAEAFANGKGGDDHLDEEGEDDDDDDDDDGGGRVQRGVEPLARFSQAQAGESDTQRRASTGSSE